MHDADVACMETPGKIWRLCDKISKATGGCGASKTNEYINQNEIKFDMRMTSDQMEQSPLDPENVRSLKHKSGVSRFQTVHFFPFIMYLYRVTRILCQLDHACTSIKTRIKNDSAHYLDDC